MKKILSFIFLFFILIVNSGCITDKLFTKSNNELPEEKKIYGQLGQHSKTIIVTGRGYSEGNSPRSQLLGERAAMLDAYRLLAEKVSGILINEYSSSKDFSLTKDQIRVMAESYVRGAEVLNVKHYDNGIVEVDMKLVLPEDKIKKEVSQNDFN